MRKSIPLISALAVLLSVFFYPYHVQTVHSSTFPDSLPDTFVVYEQSFEDGFGEWSPLGGQADLSIDSRHSKEGSTSLHVSNRAKTWNGPAMSTTGILIPGKEYELEAWVHHDGQENHTIDWTFQSEDNEKSVNYQRIATTEAGPGGWSKLSGTLKIPENTVSCSIYFESPDLDLNFNVDAITITGSDAVITTAPNKPGLTEYIFDFEEGIGDWKARGNEVVSRSSNFSYLGRYSLYVSERTKFWNAPSLDISRLIKTGTCYEYSACVMYNGRSYENEHEFQIELQYTYNGKVNYESLNSKVLQKGNWSKLTGEFTLPEQASDIHLYVQTADVEEGCEADENDLMAYYIDNVSILDSTLKNQRKLVNLIIVVFSILAAVAALTVAVITVIKKVSETNTLLASAEKDSMTDVFNRNSFEIQTAHLENCPEECRKLYITLCDVNFLKHINDNYGHQKGDDAIIRCASVLAETVGKKGCVYRTGGDEFVCITKVNMHDKIRQAMDIESQKYKGYPFAVAAGTAKYEPSEDGNIPDIKLILARSDKEMYKDKEEIKSRMKNYI